MLDRLRDYARGLTVWQRIFTIGQIVFMAVYFAAWLASGHYHFTPQLLLFLVGLLPFGIYHVALEDHHTWIRPVVQFSYRVLFAVADVFVVLYILGQVDLTVTNRGLARLIALSSIKLSASSGVPSPGPLPGVEHPTTDTGSSPEPSPGSQGRSAHPVLVLVPKSTQSPVPVSSAADTVPCVQFVSSTTVTGTAAIVRFTGSFGESRIETSGAQLFVDMCLAEGAATYESIGLVTGPIKHRFSGRFASGFGGVQTSVQLDTAFRIHVMTNKSSERLRVMPENGGIFQIDPFYTSNCGFSCYGIAVDGDWSLTSSRGDSTGTISMRFEGHGIGSDTTSKVDPADYPRVARLKEFTWHANSSSAKLPDLVNVNQGGVLVRVAFEDISFPGIKGGDIVLHRRP